MAVFRTIFDFRELTTSEIIESVSVSKATVSRIVNALKRQGFVYSKRSETSEKGRPCEVYCINGAYAYMVLFDICFERIRCYLIDLAGNIVQQKKRSVEAEVTTGAFTDALVLLLEETLAAAGITKDLVLVAGLAVPGVVNEQTGCVARIPNLWVFKQIQGYRHLSEVLGLPVLIKNVSRLSTMGEWQACYREYRSLALISFTTHYGIGGGFINSGVIHDGSRMAAGEIGDFFFDRDNFDSDYSGDMGCLESHAGLHVMIEKLESLVEAGRCPRLRELLRVSGGGMTLELIEKAVAQGDADAAEAFDETVKLWAIAAINIFSLLDPQILVIGGAITQRNDVVLERIEQYVSRGLSYKPNICLSSIGDQATVIGASAMLRDYVFKNILAAKVK